MKSTITRSLIAPLALGLTASCHTAESPRASATADAVSSVEAPLSRPETVHSSLAFPTGDERTSPILLEKSVPLEVVVGQPFEYWIKLTNLTDLELTGVEVRDEVSPHFVLVDTTLEPQAFQVVDGTLYVWDLGDLGPLETATIRVTGTTAEATTIRGEASVSYQTALVASIPVIQPMLELSVDTPSFAGVSEEVLLRVEVTNPGTGTARDITVQAELPAGLRTDGGGTLAFTVDELPAGKRERFDIELVADAAGTYETTITATAGRGLEAPPVARTLVVQEPRLTVDVDGPESSFIGSSTRFVATLRNTGDAASPDTWFGWTLPDEFTFVEASGGAEVTDESVRWNLGTLEAGAGRELALTLRADAIGLARGWVTATGTNAGDTTEIVETDIVGIPAIRVEVADTLDPILVGEEATYEIIVENQGSAAGTNIGIVCRFDEDVEVKVTTGATLGRVTDGKITFEALESLEPRAEATWRVVVIGAEAGDRRFRVELTSDQLSSPVEDSEPTTFYE